MIVVVVFLLFLVFRIMIRLLIWEFENLVMFFRDIGFFGGVNVGILVESWELWG